MAFNWVTLYQPKVIAVTISHTSYGGGGGGGGNIFSASLINPLTAIGHTRLKTDFQQRLIFCWFSYN